MRFLRLGIGPGRILYQPGGIQPDTSGADALMALVSNNNNYAVHLSDLTLSGGSVTLNGVQATSGVTRLLGSAGGPITVTLPITDRLVDALGPTVPIDGSFAVPISIQNEDAANTATLVAGDASTTLSGTMTVPPDTRRIWLLTLVNKKTVSIQNIGTFPISGGGTGSGTVTSVAQTVPVEFTISGSPITSSGTLAIGKAVESAGTVWAGPTSGGAAQPTFRNLQETYATISAETNLPNSRRLLAGTNISLTDGGAGSTLTIAASGGGSGSVTQINTTAPITGGPITTTGTIGVTDFVASGASHARGTVPDPGATPGTTKFLREDATFAVPPGGLASPLTTKGDVWGYSTVDARIPVGTNGQLLSSDSTQALGVKWVTQSAGGVLQGQEFTATGAFTFNVPASVTSVWITAMGAGGGGGGASSTAVAGGGGGAGEQIVMQPTISVGGGTITGSVGAKGTGAAGAAGSNGGNTTCGVFTAIGGKGGTTTIGGAGGGVAGGSGGSSANPGGPGFLGTAEAVSFFGGSGGGGGGNGATAAGGRGGASGGNLGGAGGTVVSSQGGGGGGASTSYGVGGAGGNGGSAGSNATAGAYGAGGGSGGGITAGTTTGGAGENGYVLIQWIS